MPTNALHKKVFYLLLSILVLAGFLRFFALGTNPPSLDWDEAALGYNAYSLLTTARDEYGRLLPVSLKSFGDYKPAVYAYLLVPAIALFSLTEFAVRLPSAVLGTLTVLLAYFLIKHFAGKRVGLLAALLLAISPWHIQFSRVAFEANAALFFVVAGFLFFAKAIKKPIFFIPAAVLLVISFYTYHTPRLVVPIIVLVWLIYEWKHAFKHKIYIVGAGLLAVVLLIPFILELFSVGASRFSSVSILTQDSLNDSIARVDYDMSHTIPFGKILHNRRVIYALAVTKGYLDHYNFDFLFLSGDGPDRHHARDMGMLYLWEAPFILVGLLTILRKKSYYPFLIWFIAAPAAAAFTSGTPHAVRALITLPTYQFFTSLGLIFIFDYIKNRGKKLFIFASIFTFIIVAASVNYYLESYYIHTPIEASEDWQYGYKEAVAEASRWTNQVDKIIVTYKYDQPYIYFLFYGRVDPRAYQKLYANEEIARSFRSFGKYEFRNIDWAKDSSLTHTLLIGTAVEIPKDTAGLVKEIYFLDGTVAFRIVKR